MQFDTNSPTAWELGFTDDLFYGTIDLNYSTREVTIVNIESRDKRKGNVKRFYRGLQKLGWEVVVTRPCDNMNNLCKGLKYDVDWEHNSLHDVWTWTWRGKPKAVKNDSVGTLQSQNRSRREGRKPKV